MMALFLKDGDERLEGISDFEVITVDEHGVVQGIDWHIDTTFNAVFDKLEEKHRKGIEVSVLDYGDELQATVTVNAKSVKHHYIARVA